MSFSADVEHIYTPKEEMPSSLHGAFPNGCCAVFANEELVAAIPATNDDTNELADLLEIVAIGATKDDPALKAYFDKRDELCGATPYIQFTLFFKSEMEKQKAREEGPRAKYLKLASSARNN